MSAKPLRTARTTSLVDGGAGATVTVPLVGAVSATVSVRGTASLAAPRPSVA